MVAIVLEFIEQVGNCVNPTTIIPSQSIKLQRANTWTLVTKPYQLIWLTTE